MSEPKKTARLYIFCAFIIQLTAFIILFSELGGRSAAALFLLLWGNNVARTWVRKL